MKNLNASLTDLPPTLANVETRLDTIEHQLGTVLFLSAVNLVANVMTILVAFMSISR